MWKKDEGQPGQPTAEVVRPRTTAAASTSAGRATIGPSISIQGDVTGSEDLLIQGQVDGSVTLALHAVAVGDEGRVNANISGRIITIEGEVEGDLTAQEQIVLRGSARVQGDIKAPRVVLEDGATFRGLVDMGASPKNGMSPESTAGSATTSVRDGQTKSPVAKGTNGATDKPAASAPPVDAVKASGDRTADAHQAPKGGKKRAGSMDPSRPK